MSRGRGRRALLACVLAALVCASCAGEEPAGPSRALEASDALADAFVAEMMSRPSRAISPESRAFLGEANAALADAQSAEDVLTAEAQGLFIAVERERFRELFEERQRRDKGD